MNMACWYEWRTGELRWNMTTPKPNRGDWPRCGAKAKSTGKPCRARALKNGRCKYHGGLSTGPKTLAGKIKALMNLKQYKNYGLSSKNFPA